MAVEIERKFLVKYLPEAQLSNPVTICQDYIVNKKEIIVRLRIAGNKAFITIKGATANLTRREYEYSIPVTDAKEMISRFSQGKVIEKTRYKIEHKGFIWEIDQFSGKNQGLVIAEIELEFADQVFEKPDWVGEEVSQDPRYFNSNLTSHPYSSWKS